jgi:hypothetical protein
VTLPGQITYAAWGRTLIQERGFSEDSARVLSLVFVVGGWKDIVAVFDTWLLFFEAPLYPSISLVLFVSLVGG